MSEITCDVLIVGGGVGGCAAAIAATALGMKVILTEETGWIGGQLTSQAVPPDEHPWIEQFGCTQRYREYRDLVRERYRSNPLLTTEARRNRLLNPGGGWVSRLCHEPRIGVDVLEQMLGPAESAGLLKILRKTVPVAAQTDGERVLAVRIRDLDTDAEQDVTARFVLDATELGDLLPMTATEYLIGAESNAQTQERSALDGASDPGDVQGLTWVFAMAHDAGSHRVIDKPVQYDRWRSFRPQFWPGSFLGFTDINPQTGEPRDLPMFSGKRVSWYDGDFGLFTYRQIVEPRNFAPGVAPHPVTIVNWPQNDYFVESILDVDAATASQRLGDAKQLSLSLLYWLQTEAPRADGGVGYPGLYLRPDITGTSDGLAKAPYIRESRRIKALFTIRQQDVEAEALPGRDRASEFFDSVGVGSYRLDLHPSTSGRSYLDTSTLPFHIPLGSLIPEGRSNLLAACKNLGVTHITNGCYRLHPVEWNIGESAGLFAAYCIKNLLHPAQVVESREKVQEFQRLCTGHGIEIAWPRLRAL